MIDKIDFKKKDAPYRREAKFHASGRGNLAQIAGVYNATITLSHCAFFLYPGQLCWIDAGMRDRPNNPDSIAFQLGLGGYYNIIEVQHNIEAPGGSSFRGYTKVEAVWVNYGVENKIDQKLAVFRKSDNQKKIGDVNCDDILDQIHTELANFQNEINEIRDANTIAQQRAIQQSNVGGAQNAASGINTTTSTNVAESGKTIPVGAETSGFQIDTLTLIKSGVIKVTNWTNGPSVTDPTAAQNEGANVQSQLNSELLNKTFVTANGTEQATLTKLPTEFDSMVVGTYTSDGALLSGQKLNGVQIVVMVVKATRTVIGVFTTHGHGVTGLAANVADDMVLYASDEFKFEAHESI